MSNTRKSFIAVMLYIIFFIILAHSAYLTLAETNEDLFKLLGFIFFQILSAYLLSSLSRLDGYWFSTQNSSLFVSIKNYLEKYHKFISLLGLLIGTGVLGIYFENTISAFFKFILMTIILFFYGSTIYFWKSNSLSIQSIKKLLCKLILVFLLIIISDNYLPYLIQQIILFVLILFSLVSPMYFAIRDLSKVLRKVIGKNKSSESTIMSFFNKLLLSEYLAADQSKKNTENFTLLKSIFGIEYHREQWESQKYKKDELLIPSWSTSKVKKTFQQFHEEIHKKIKFEYENNKINIKELSKVEEYKNVIHLLNLFSTSMDSVFLKPEKLRKSLKDSSFLDLKNSKEFDVFISNAEENLNGSEHLIYLETIKTKYEQTRRSFTEAIMDSRTENIKIRNQNNLIVGILIFLVTLIEIYLTKTTSLTDFLLKFLVWMVFIRIILRTYEIGKAFYNDILESGYKNSFLTGKDRILLAFKSVIEISFLAASIYQLNTVFLANDPIFKYCLNVSCAWWKTIEYAVSVSLFNVSFPESLIPQSNRNFMWLSTHAIQVISSVLLITIVINSYMGREKKLIYFESIITEDNEYVLLKKIKNSYRKENIILRVDLRGSKDKNDVRQKIVDKLHDRFHEGIISEDDFSHAIKWIETNDYFLSF